MLTKNNPLVFGFISSSTDNSGLPTTVPLPPSGLSSVLFYISYFNHIVGPNVIGSVIYADGYASDTQTSLVSLTA